MFPDIPTVVETNRAIAERRAGFDRHIIEMPFAVDGPEDEDDSDVETEEFVELGGEG